MTELIDIDKKVNFDVFVNMLEKISQINGKIQEKKNLLKKFIEAWYLEVEKYKSQNIKVVENYYSFMRLLIPDEDTRVYGFKEAKLSTYIIDFLGISKNNFDAMKLLNYRAPEHAQSDGDFAMVAYFIFKSRLKNETTLSIADVNKHLDLIACNNNKGKDGDVAITNSISYLLRNLSPLQLKWLLRILLKDLKIGLGLNSILEAYNPNAINLFNFTSSLKNVCEILNSPNKHLENVSISLFLPCRPMLSDKANVNEIEKLLNGAQFYIEIKYDGERFQLHKNENNYSYYSRNGNNFTDSFGGNSSNGNLTPYIHSCFYENVKNCILDGEICAYDTTSSSIIPRGSSDNLKLFKSKQLPSNIQVCFFVFDILLYNDEVLVNKPLNERVIYLNNSFNSLEGRIEIVQRELANTNQHVIDALNRSIDACLEGIVIKDPKSIYKPNVRSDSGWFKVKPDYVFGLNDDLDVLIIGGYYGVGRRSGLLSHFLLAVAADDMASSEPKLFYAFCKVGSGYSLKELCNFNRRLDGKWIKYDKNKPPAHLVVSSYEKPDVWIEPRDSLIVQIKAAEIVPSDKYKTGITLRFPRLERFRDDKLWFECMKLQELIELNLKNKGKLTSKNFCDENGNYNYQFDFEKKTILNQNTKQPRISSCYKGVDASNVEKIEKFFQNKEFCVIKGNEDYNKEKLEKHILEYGGKIVQNPGVNTHCVVASELIYKVYLYVQKDLYDIVKPDWVIKCVNNKQYYQWTPNDMLHARRVTCEQFKQQFDKYGDSYLENTENVLQLQQTFENVKLNMCENFNNNDLHSEIARFEKNQSFTKYGLLRSCNIYLDSSIENVEVITLKLLSYGAIINDEICDSTTHCIVNESNTVKVNELKMKIRENQLNMQILSKSWIEECIKCQRLLD